MTRNDDILGKVYSAASQEEIESAYDAWANQYDADLFSFGYRLPAVAAAVFGRFVDVEAAPILDAGCGTGLQTEPLVMAGYGPFTGFDLSNEMLAVSRRKKLHESLHKMALGGGLGFDADSFAVSFCIGTITPGHAGPDSFKDLIRVTEPGGLVIFSLRTDDGQDPAYPEAVLRHERERDWKRRFVTDGFPSLPNGEPEVISAVYVYEVLR